MISFVAFGGEFQNVVCIFIYFMGMGGGELQLLVIGELLQPLCCFLCRNFSVPFNDCSFCYSAHKLTILLFIALLCQCLVALTTISKCIHPFTPN